MTGVLSQIEHSVGIFTHLANKLGMILSLTAPPPATNFFDHHKNNFGNMTDFFSQLTTFTCFAIVLAFLCDGSAIERPCWFMVDVTVNVARFRIIVSVLGLPCREHVRVFVVIACFVVASAFMSALSAYSSSP